MLSCREEFRTACSSATARPRSGCEATGAQATLSAEFTVEEQEAPGDRQNIGIQEASPGGLPQTAPADRAVLGVTS